MKYEKKLNSTSVFLKLNIGIILLTFAAISLGQTSEIKIRFIGNCGLHITDGVKDIYTDFPYKSGAHNYMEYEGNELDSVKENAYFIFTHKHSDHYLKNGMNAFMTKKKGKMYGKWNIHEMEQLRDEIPDFEIIGYKTKHHFSFTHYSFLITWHKKKIYFSGDTENPETILTMTNLDWAFIPAWLVNSINESNQKLDSKMVGIYHIGPKDDIDIKGEKVLMLNKQGAVITIPF